MSSPDSDVRTISIFEEQPVPVEGGTIEWVPVRRRLGIRAFGTNAFRAARKGDPVVEDHVESLGQEELYVVVAGRMSFVAGEQELDVPAGNAVFVAYPALRRGGVALEDDTVVLAVGGWVDRPYHHLPWEPLYLTQEALRQEDWARATEILERETGEHRDTAIVRRQLRPEMTTREAADSVWTLASERTYLALVRDRGWDPDDYEHWLIEQLVAALLPHGSR